MSMPGPLALTGSPGGMARTSEENPQGTNAPYKQTTCSAPKHLSNYRNHRPTGRSRELPLPHTQEGDVPVGCWEPRARPFLAPNPVSRPKKHICTFGVHIWQK